MAQSWTKEQRQAQRERAKRAWAEPGMREERGKKRRGLRIRGVSGTEKGLLIEVTCRFPREMFWRASARAEDQNISFAEVVRQAMGKFL